MCSHHPIHCIIPPYMMNKLVKADRGKTASFKAAVNTIDIDMQLRSKRRCLPVFIKTKKQNRN